MIPFNNSVAFEQPVNCVRGSIIFLFLLFILIITTIIINQEILNYNILLLLLWTVMKREI